MTAVLLCVIQGVLSTEFKRVYVITPMRTITLSVISAFSIGWHTHNYIALTLTEHCVQLNNGR